MAVRKPVYLRYLILGRLIDAADTANGAFCSGLAAASVSLDVCPPRRDLEKERLRLVFGCVSV